MTIHGPGDPAAYEFQVVQFHVPRAAANALDVDAIAQRAAELGLEKGRFDQSTYRQRPGQTLVTCRRTLAPVIIDAWTELAGKSEGQLVIDCAAAAKTALDALRPQTR